jgi:hypothetical protein
MSWSEISLKSKIWILIGLGLFVVLALFPQDQPQEVRSVPTYSPSIHSAPNSVTDGPEWLRAVDRVCGNYPLASRQFDRCVERVDQMLQGR